MPESKSRHAHEHPHHHSNTHDTHPKPKKTNRIVIVASLFFAFLGFAISYYIDDTSITKGVIGGLIGAAAGYIFATQINKSFSKK